MSYNTIVRSFNHENLYKAAQMHNLQTIYTLKYIIYMLITFFTCQNIIKMRELRRKEEIYKVANDILKNLPHDYNNLNDEEYKLHTNMDKKYQIKCINKNLYLSTIDQKFNNCIMIANLNNEKNFESMKNKLQLIEFQRKYDKLSQIKINNQTIIDNLHHLRIDNYQKHNKIDDLLNYFNNVYTASHRDLTWAQKNIAITKNIEKFKIKLDYFIKNRYSKTYNVHNNPITADDIYELTTYFLYHNTRIKEELINIGFGDPIIINGIMQLMDLNEAIKISNIQAIHISLIELNNV